MESKLNLKNLPPTTKWEAGSATTVWLICLQSFSVYNIDRGFFFALWAEKWKINQHTVFIDFGAGFSAADRAWNP